MDHFELHAPFAPTGDQPEAIAKLVQGIRDGDREQTLLGVGPQCDDILPARENVPGIGENLLALLRGDDTVAHALENGEAELVLGFVHNGGESRLADEKLARGGGDRVMLCYAQQIMQMFEPHAPSPLPMNCPPYSSAENVRK